MPISEWATRAVVLLVAAAPCALVMSTPVAIAAGIGRAGLTGVLIKGGVHLENLGRIKTVGEPIVTDVIPLNGNATDVLQSAYSVEWLSEHPLAQAIVQKAEKADLQSRAATDFSALPGAGARAAVGGRTIYVGKPEMFENAGSEGLIYGWESGTIRHAVKEIFCFIVSGGLYRHSPCRQHRL